jgi:hypothetical protein
VHRQRRREEFIRTAWATRIAEKDGKAEAVSKERQRLWELRRRAGVEAYKYRAAIKQYITDMRIKSKLDPQGAEDMMKRMLGQDIFSEKIVAMGAPDSPSPGDKAPAADVI